MGIISLRSSKACSFYTIKVCLLAAGLIWAMLNLNVKASSQVATAPQLGSISPSSASPGGPGFVLSAIGSNFVSASVIQWNGSSRTTSFIDANHLQADILNADIANPGAANVEVFTPGAGVSNSTTFIIAYPTPQLDSISPSSASPGGPGFVLSAIGSNFMSVSVVRWNGSSRTTSFIDANHLQANILSADIANPGAANVEVFTPGTGVSNSKAFIIAYSKPLLGSLSPSSVSPGGPGFVLSAIGTNFVSASVVQWNGSNRTTTFINSNRLQADILASDIANPGTINVAVFTPGGGTSIPLPFTIALPPPLLSSIVPSSTSAGGPGFVLMALGTNQLSNSVSRFTNGSVVQWNGSNRVTTYVDPGHLQASILASDLVSQGPASVTVFTPGAGVSNPWMFEITAPRQGLNLVIKNGGLANHSLPEGTGPAQTGYATITLNSGAVPFGTAVYSFKQNGVTVSEVGVSPSPPTSHARIFIDYRSAATAVPGRISSGVIDANTGIAAVNYGNATANVIYTLRDLNGNTLTSGHGTIAAAKQFAKFISQLKDVAPDFNLPVNFPTTIKFGSLEILSDQPLSVLALRGSNNQRGEFIITTTPIADLTQPPGNSPVYFPQFADGGGYTTSLILLNTSDTIENGTLQILDNNGFSMNVIQAGGSPDSMFRYSIPAGGVFHFQTDGSPKSANIGWVRLLPDPSMRTPVGLGVFSYNPDAVLVSESGISAANFTSHARVYIDMSRNYCTGLAIANTNSNSERITIDAFQDNGVTRVGNSPDSLQLAGFAHTAKFADALIKGLPSGFKGVFDISSADSFAVLAMRCLFNERSDFLMTAIPIADLNLAAPAPILFPQIANSGGYSTEFIFLSPGGASNITLDMFSEAGAPLDPGN